MRSYLDLIDVLPLPTLEQTERFAEYVTDAHSWYKHLPPFPPGADFLFHVDPTSGRSLLRARGGERAYVDRVKGDDEFHYTWMPTSEYRESLGHWEYSTDRGPGLFYGSTRSGWKSVGPKRTAVLDAEGNWIDISSEFLEAGGCELTAVVHEHFEVRFACGGRHEGNIDALGEATRTRPEDPLVRRYRPLLGSVQLYRERHERQEYDRERMAELDRDVERFAVSERSLQRKGILYALLRVRQWLLEFRGSA